VTVYPWVTDPEGACRVTLGAPARGRRSGPVAVDAENRLASLDTRPAGRQEASPAGGLEPGPAATATPADIPTDGR